MLLKNIFYLPLLALLLLATACSDDGTGPVKKASVLRFDFPQGEHSWDKEFEEIARDWGMYVIYREIDSTDLNRSWTAPTSTIASYQGDPVPEKYMEVYLEIIRNSLLASLNKENESHRKQLPVYLFLLNNFRNSRGQTQQIYLNGFDYWVLSFTDEELEAGLSPAVSHQIACTFGYLPISSGFASGTLEVPDEFIRTTDYETPVASEINGRLPFGDAHDPINFYLRRGFLKQTSTGFKLYAGISNYTPEFMPWIPGAPWDPTYTRNSKYEREIKDRQREDFANYIRSAMMYTEDEIRTLYPLDAADPLDRKGNAIIQQKYDIVIRYMLSQGYDLQKIAQIKTIQN